LQPVPDPGHPSGAAPEDVNKVEDAAKALGRQ